MVQPKREKGLYLKEACLMEWNIIDTLHKTTFKKNDFKLKLEGWKEASGLLNSVVRKQAEKVPPSHTLVIPYVIRVMLKGCCHQMPEDHWREQEWALIKILTTYAQLGVSNAIDKRLLCVSSFLCLNLFSTVIILCICNSQVQWTNMILKRLYLRNYM